MPYLGLRLIAIMKTRYAEETRAAPNTSEYVTKTPPEKHVSNRTQSPLQM